MSLNDPERDAPLTATLWYVHEPGGELWTVIPTSRKAKLLKVGTPVSLCAQQEAQPPKYVSVSGPVTFIGPIACGRGRPHAVKAPKHRPHRLASNRRAPPRMSRTTNRRSAGASSFGSPRGSKSSPMAIR